MKHVLAGERFRSVPGEKTLPTTIPEGLTRERICALRSFPFELSSQYTIARQYAQVIRGVTH